MNLGAELENVADLAIRLALALGFFDWLAKRLLRCTVLGQSHFLPCVQCIAEDALLLSSSKLFSRKTDWLPNKPSST